MMNPKNISLSFPTWNDIKNELLIQDKTDPSAIFGNHPYKEPLTLPWEIKVGSLGIGPYGIDIPVLLEPNKKNNKVIIIIGESALRKDGQLQNKNMNIILGTPYALHMNKHLPKQCEVYKLIFDKLLEIGYSIYITDIIKVWEKGKKLAYDGTDIKLLKNELDLIEKLYPRPVIVTFGNKASSALRTLKINYIVICLKHPSRQNWNNWKLNIYEKAIYDKQDINYAKERYPDKKSKTTEVIVANEALAEILEKI